MEKKKTIFSGKDIHVISNSHNDIAWLDTPLGTIDFRNKYTITRAVEMLENDKDFKHTMECGLFLKDWLYLNPSLKDRMNTLIKEKRFNWGATYTEPYENSLFGDGLARQYYLGKRWIDNTFPGSNVRSTWNQDVPSLAMQSAQIMKKAGVDFIGTSRMKPGFFKWFSPDGSYVHGFSNGHYYGNSLSAIIKLKHDMYDNRNWEESMKKEYNFEGTEDLLAKSLDFYQNFYEKRNLPTFLPYFNIRDYDAPTNFRKLNEVLAKSDKYDFPNIKHSNYEEVMDEAIKVFDKDEQWNEIHGDRPNLWVYHQIAHAKAYKNMNRGLRSIIQAEQMSTLANKVNGLEYDKARITDAWSNLLYVDHGWGGYNGHVTDAVYENSLIHGRNEAEAILDKATNNLFSNIKVDNKSHVFSVFNSHVEAKNDFVEIEIDWRKLNTLRFDIFDSSNNKVEYQIISEPKPYTIKMLVEVLVPALGYETFTLKPIEEGIKKPVATDKTELEITTSTNMKFENDFYSMHLVEGGFETIIDKDTKENIVKQTGIRAFEVYDLVSHGNGAGEFSEIQQPSWQYGDNETKYGSTTGYVNRSSNHGMRWICKMDEGYTSHNGNLVTILTGRANMDGYVLEQEVWIYNKTKRIDVKVDIKSFTGKMYKEIRVALPLNDEFKGIKYEVPYGIGEVGKTEFKGAIGVEGKEEQEYFSSAIYPTEGKDIRPREVLTWCGSQSPKTSVLMSVIDVAAFDFKPPKVMYEYFVSLDPILLASRHSCMEKGNPYENIGDHSYTFTMVSNDVKKQREDIKTMESQSFPLKATEVFYNYEANGKLPQKYEGIKLTGDVKVSSIKLAEDSDDIIVRMYEAFGEESKFDIKLFNKETKLQSIGLLENESKENATQSIKPYSIETYKI